MSANESDHLEFRGTDLKECERFIAAVNKHAHAQGKLRDDQWIADFVAVCMAEDALIWWSLLDEETQGSWRLLRKEMISKFRLVFQGNSGAEAEDFVYQVRHRALRAGKLNDPQWMADFASQCFVGSALRWYLSLNPSIRGDWDSLQQGILTQYGQQTEEDFTAPITPTPALAASPPASIPRRHRGRIRAFAKTTSANYYISRNVGYLSSEPGRLPGTSVIAEALEVEYEVSSGSDGPYALIIPNDQIGGCNRLGLKWYAADIANANHAALCGVDSGSGVGSPGPAYAGALWTTAWTISSSPTEREPKPVTVMTASGVRLVHFVGLFGSGINLWFRITKLPWDASFTEVEYFFDPL